MRTRSIVPLVTVLAACGPDQIQVAEHDEVCGQPGPLRILDLDPDRPLSVVHQVRHEDGERVFQIGYRAEPSTPNPFGGADTESFEYWAVGSCGESPRLISDDVHWGSFDHWPDLTFACDYETGALEILDPSGVRPRNLVFQTSTCALEETPWGLVEVQAHDEDLGAVVLFPYPDDPWTQTSMPRTLLDPVRIRAVPQHSYPTYHEVLAIFADDIFAITPANELIHFSLLDGTSTTEATGVRELEISADQRWLVWQDVVQTGGDEEWPAGAVYLRDRQLGTTERLADAPLTAPIPSSLHFAAQGVVRLQLGYLYKAPERLYRLSDLESFDLPLGVVTQAAIPDGRLLVGDAFNGGSFALVDPSTGATTPIFDDEATIEIHEDGFEILEDVYCCVNDDDRDEGQLWSVDFDGARELLAHRMTAAYEWLSDDRVVGVLDVDSNVLGDLIVVDPVDLEERLVDRDVPLYRPEIDDDDTIVYGVSDDERTGVWLARVAAP